MIRYLQNAYQRYAAKAMFSHWSPSYEDDVAANAYSAADKVAEAAARHAPQSDVLNPPAIADIGIGTGLLAQQIYDTMPCSIAGLDFTEDMMAVCLQREITDLLIKCDVGKDHWPLEDASYDMVLSAGLVEYLTPKMLQHFLDESVRILKTGGLMIFTYVPSKEAGNTVTLWPGKSGKFLSCSYDPAALETQIRSKNFILLEHLDSFAGSVFRDGSTYPYRLIAARKS